MAQGMFGDAIQKQMQKNQRYAPLISMINALPEEGQWTADQKFKWLEAFDRTLDYCVQVEEKEE